MVADWQLPSGVDRTLWDYFRDPQLARAYDEQLVDSHLRRIDQEFARKHFAVPGRLLDLGCGTGRLCLDLARCGHWCLGVDLSAEMLKVAREKAAAEGVAVHLLQANMVNLACLEDGAFDHVACLFSTLGMVIGAEHRQQVIEHAYRLLRAGGKLVLHVHNRWFNIWHPRMRGWLIRDAVRSLFGRGGDFVMPAHGGLGSITMHLFTRREAVALLQRAGFRIAEVKPISLRANGLLRAPYFFGGLRAYGYLLAAVK